MKAAAATRRLKVRIVSVGVAWWLAVCWCGGTRGKAPSPSAVRRCDASGWLALCCYVGKHRRGGKRRACPRCVCAAVHGVRCGCVCGRPRVCVSEAPGGCARSLAPPTGYAAQSRAESDSDCLKTKRAGAVDPTRAHAARVCARVGSTPLPPQGAGDRERSETKQALNAPLAVPVAAQTSERRPWMWIAFVWVDRGPCVVFSGYLGWWDGFQPKLRMRLIRAKNKKPKPIGRAVVKRGT